MAKQVDFEQTKKEIEKLTGSKRERAEKLLNKAAFMERELVKLQDILAEKGWTEVYTNGATQQGIKKSSEADVYVQIMKSYLATLKQIDDMLPAAPPEQEDDLLGFIKG